MDCIISLPSRVRLENLQVGGIRVTDSNIEAIKKGDLSLADDRDYHIIRLTYPDGKNGEIYYFHRRDTISGGKLRHKGDYERVDLFGPVRSELKRQDLYLILSCLQSSLN